MIFVFIGTGSAIAAFTLGFDTGGHVLISAAFGFGLTVVIYAVGEISGGEISSPSSQTEFPFSRLRCRVSGSIRVPFEIFSAMRWSVTSSQVISILLPLAA